jgi:hypothetical protein
MENYGSLTTIGSSGKKGVVKPYLCKDCGETNPDNFYGDAKIHCKKCHAKATHQRLIDTRNQAIEFLGGKCNCCGYDRWRGALQFHHKDPTTKDPVLFKKRKNFENLKPELEKCILLCSNCHAEEHAKMAGWIK